MPAAGATATGDRESRRARASVDVRAARSSHVTRAFDGGALVRCLLLLSVLLLVQGCSANAPSTGNTTTAATSGSVARPATEERAGEVRANGQSSPTANGAASNSVIETKATEKGAMAGVGTQAQQAASTSTGEQGEGAAASAAYEGFYEVLGARPKGFEQFGNFMIRAPEGGRISGAVVPLEGKIYEFERATLVERKLTFATKKVGGISYTFDGQFLAAPPFAASKKAAVAEGLVRKFRGDQPVAEAGMKFYFDEGGEDP